MINQKEAPSNLAVSEEANEPGQNKTKLYTIMNYPHPYIQPYKGKDTRHDCPSCKAKLSFTLYLDGSTHKPIHDIVGKCNRESKCGYHYTPKQYFIDNPIRRDEACLVSTPPSTPKSIEPPRPIGTIPFNFVENTTPSEAILYASFAKF